MRFGVISDVHGNLHALQAVVSELRRRGVDGWFSLGDLIGYGPQPNECVEAVAALEPLGIAGNHELIALGHLPGNSSSERAHRSHQWTATVLRDDVAAYLSCLPWRAETHGVVLAHGSLDDPEEYVNNPDMALQQLRQLAQDYPKARMLLLGNTHRQQLVSEREGRLSFRAGKPVRLDDSQRHLGNPGSVGQSRQWEWPPPARAMLLDVQSMTPTFLRVRYDVRASRRELASLRLPYRSIQSPQPLTSVAKRSVRKIVRVLWSGR